MLDQRPDSQADKLTAAGCTDGHSYVGKATGKHANRPELRTALKVTRKGDEFTITNSTGSAAPSATCTRSPTRSWSAGSASRASTPG
jgi:hypothetical protein